MPMKREANANDTSRSVDKFLKNLSVRKHLPYPLFFALLFLYILSSIAVMKIAQPARPGSPQITFTLFGMEAPLQTLAGGISSLANMCILLMVFFFGKQGFFTALTILLIQFPTLIIRMFRAHNLSSLPGLFINVMTLLAICIIFANNTREDKYQRRIRDQAVTDPLTGLPNRFACSEMMNHLIQKNEKFVLATLNLNNFKSINNTMGHSTGNDVLIELATRLMKAVEGAGSGTKDFICTQNGDEFSLILRDYPSLREAHASLEYYESILEERLTLDGCDYFLSASIGYAEFPADATDSEDLLTYASAAMYHCKRTGRITHFDQKHLGTERTLEMERKIHSALQEDRIFFHLQPQYDMDHHLIGFEALARMRDTDGSIISPGEFIPVAEQVGLIGQVDSTVFRKSATFFGDLIRRTRADLTLSVNISVKHLMKNDFLDEVREILHSSGIAAHQLEIEITESVMIDSVEKALQCINELKKMDIRIAIDDFGTGYSALSYLNRFPADILKVDKSFIDEMNTSESSKQYVAAIITMGHVMNFGVISEGVEKPDQLETLREIGCDYIQGFIWGRPLSREDAGKLVEDAVHQKKCALIP